MRRYGISLLLFMAALLGLAATWNHAYAWMIFLVGYFVLSISWVVTTVRAPRTRWRLPVVFAPLALPIFLVVLSTLAMRETDAAAMIALSLLPFIAGVFLVTVVGAMGIALDMSAPDTKDKVEP